MTDTLTICARAMWDEFQRGRPQGFDFQPWENADDYARGIYLNFARACLTALAENISDRMLSDGWLDTPSGWSGSSDDLRAPFTAMINVAKGEGK